MMSRRHIPQEERSTTIQQALYLVLRRIDLRMVFTQPVFQAISLPWFQNQSFNQFGLALFLSVNFTPLGYVMPNLLAIYCSSLNITSDRNRSFAKEIRTFFCFP